MTSSPEPRAQELDARQDAYLRREFPSRIAHDIRSPLGIIAGTLVELRRGAEAADPAAKQLLDLTQRALRQLQRIADRLSLVARLEGGRVDWEPRSMELESVLQKAVEEIQQTRRRRSVSVELELAPDLPPLEADPNLVQRACEELLDNAVRHARKLVRIEARASGSMLVLDVIDDGPPPAEPIDQLFSRFTPDASRAGLGLGLSMVRDIADRHGGSVELSAVDPVTFRLQLPLSARKTGGPKA